MWAMSGASALLSLVGLVLALTVAPGAINMCLGAAVCVALFAVLGVVERALR